VSELRPSDVQIPLKFLRTSPKFCWGQARGAFLVDRPLLKFLGFISYGLYLIHVLAFRFVEILFSRVFQLERIS
jgi:peptidoglycan/LPS O-acetylase OafA/YrhL